MELTKNAMIEIFKETATNSDTGTVEATERADQWIMGAIRRAVSCIEDGALTIDKDSAHNARYWVGIISTKGTIRGSRMYPDMVQFLTSTPVSDALWKALVAKYQGASK